MEYLNQGGDIRLSGLVKDLLSDRALAFGPLKISVHLSQAHVGNSLDTVQMLHAGPVQMGGGDSGGVHGLRDECIDIIEFRLGQLYVCLLYTSLYPHLCGRYVLLRLDQ